MFVCFSENILFKTTYTILYWRRVPLKGQGGIWVIKNVFEKATSNRAMRKNNLLLNFPSNLHLEIVVLRSVNCGSQSRDTQTWIEFARCGTNCGLLPRDKSFRQIWLLLFVFHSNQRFQKCCAPGTLFLCFFSKWQEYNAPEYWASCDPAMSRENPESGHFLLLLFPRVWELIPCQVPLAEWVPYSVNLLFHSLTIFLLSRDIS